MSTLLQTRAGTVLAKPCRLLVVNPNGNPAVTDLVRASAQRALGPHTRVEAINPADSPRSIETPDHRRLAEPLAIELLSRHPDYDGYVMACFDDIALAEGRRFLRGPVVGAAEAAVAAARFLADRFAIVTTVETMVPGIHKLLAGLGATGRCTVHATGVGVAAAAGEGAAVDRSIDQAIARARRDDGAEAIILGSGGLTGRAGALAERHGLPVIDSIEAALVMAEAMAQMQARQQRA
ncbi:aspartate/glutamate racemase family protein [Ponticoccus litoralis]|uniref:Aspartate/glutamate racemase family protein n=1 Tax=Ponticoccus litoralis TaxID=422297 RepID=A0AAW9SJW0_9RHOB